MSHHDMDIAVLITCGVLLAGMAAMRISSHGSMPGLLLHLGTDLGIGEAGLRIQFDNTQLIYNISALLVGLLLFDGGFTIRWAEFRPAASRARLLGTVGVLMSVAMVLFIAAPVLGVDLRTGTLMVTIVSPTDAAAVFTILRRLPLRSKMRITLEGEPGFNDPPVIIIVAVVVSDAWNQMSVTGMLTNGLFQLTADALIGAAVAMVGQAFLHRISLPGAGLYSLATLTITLTTCSAAGVADGSELLTAYIAGLWLGNQALPHHSTTEGFTGSVSWLTQIGLSVVLRLLASPSQLLETIIPALVIGSALTFIARLISVSTCLTPFRGKLGIQLFISWAGIHGALPIMLVTIPLIHQLSEALHMFHVTLLLVVTFTLVQGPLLPKLVPWTGVLEQISPRELQFGPSPLEGINASSVQFRVLDTGRLMGMWVSDLRLPREAVVSMTIHGKKILIPGRTLRFQGRDELLLAVDSSLVERARGRLTLINEHGPLVRWLASGRSRRRPFDGD